MTSGQSKPQDAVPAFDEWVRYCMLDGYDAFHKRKPVVWPMERIPALTLAEYLARLFEAAGVWVNAYTPQQIANAVWFIGGVGSEYFHQARDASVPNGLQVRWVRSISTLYRQVFDPLCNRCNTRRRDDLTNEDPIDIAVYMFWDMNCLTGAAMFPGSPHLVDPIFTVLQDALNCRTCACKKSALHGLGHLQPYHSQKVEKIIDKFLRKRSNIPEWLATYAMAARSGVVQ